jgi:2-isopropylmalate synthase
MPAAKPRIHVFLATSKIHREFKLKKAQSEILKQAAASIKFAKSFVQDIEFSPEDASRTEPEFLAQVVEAAIDAGATTVNIPDTVGYAIPERIRGCDQALVRHGSEYRTGCDPCALPQRSGPGCGQFPGGRARTAHAASNAPSTVWANARAMPPLEEMVMALKVRTRIDFYDLYTGIKTERLYKTSRLVSQLTGMNIQRNKAIVGANAFAHESGIHQDGMLKERSTYEIMRPQEVGIEDTDLVLGKHSGRHAFKHRSEPDGAGLV